MSQVLLRRRYLWVVSKINLLDLLGILAQSLDCVDHRHGVSTGNDGQGYRELKVSLQTSQNVLDSRMDLQRIYQCLTNDTWNEESCEAGAFYQENLSSLKQPIVWTLCESHEIRTASWLVTRWLVSGHHQCQSSKMKAVAAASDFQKETSNWKCPLQVWFWANTDDSLLESKHEASCCRPHKVAGSMPPKLNSRRRIKGRFISAHRPECKQTILALLAAKLYAIIESRVESRS